MKDISSAKDTDLIDELGRRLRDAHKKAALSARAETFSPIEELGKRLRAERKSQGLTLNDLCELSGVAYATLNKMEQGNPTAQMNTVVRVAQSLGLNLWIG